MGIADQVCPTQDNSLMMLDDEMLGQLFHTFLLLCPRARHHKVVTVSEHRHGNYARMTQTRRKLASVVSHRCHDLLTRNTEAPFVPYIALSRTE